MATNRYVEPTDVMREMKEERIMQEKLFPLGSTALAISSSKGGGGGRPRRNGRSSRPRSGRRPRRWTAADGRGQGNGRGGCFSVTF